MAVDTYDVAAARKHFPALNSSQVFFDNAGGSQTLGDVVDSVRQYLLDTNVQLGATYKTSKSSTQLYNEGCQAGAAYVNAQPDEVVFGSSTTQLFRNLSSALRPHFPPGSEIVCSSLDHEANIASWVMIAEDMSLTLKWWTPRAPTSSNPQLTPDTLEPLLTEQTRLVTCTHASNILGTITPIRQVADMIHAKSPHGLLCVDGVALAPHRALDMQALGVDIYGFSWYKVYGPHVAQLYVRRSVQDKCMRSLGHYFKSGQTLEDKLGLAGASYELVQAVPQVVEYLRQQGWDKMTAHEEHLQEVLLDYLNSKPALYRILGVPTKDSEKRVPVISFQAQGHSSKAVVEKVENQTDFGFRWGHFYSKRLCDDVLALDDEGVVRVSMCHYNTLEEVHGLVRAVDQVCDPKDL
ncbi:MAG: hypothetical protein Q9159_004432 [Coniocarpon cinnabarinum]